MYAFPIPPQSLLSTIADRYSSLNFINLGEIPLNSLTNEPILKSNLRNALRRITKDRAVAAADVERLLPSMGTALGMC